MDDVVAGRRDWRSYLRAACNSLGNKAALALEWQEGETATGIFILSAIAIWATLHNFGPLVMETENQSLLILQVATAVLAITALALAAAMAERRRAEEALTKEKSLASQSAASVLWLI